MSAEKQVERSVRVKRVQFHLHSIARKLTFATPDKVVELVERGGGFKDLAERQSFDHGIAIGRGGIYLSLTDEQYAALKRR